MIHVTEDLTASILTVKKLQISPHLCSLGSSMAHTAETGALHEIQTYNIFPFNTFPDMANI
jgi:hypothetical protein